MALFAQILVDLVGIGRIGFAMERDRLLPPVVAKVSRRTGTPVRFTLGAAALVMIVGGLIPLKTLADLVSIGALFAIGMAVYFGYGRRHARVAERPDRRHDEVATPAD